MSEAVVGSDSRALQAGGRGSSPSTSTNHIHFKEMQCIPPPDTPARDQMFDSLGCTCAASLCPGDSCNLYADHWVALAQGWTITAYMFEALIVVAISALLFGRF
jgi:hypothetical protein